MGSPLEDKSSSSSSPMQTEHHAMSSSNSGRSNPFSIDYILSNAKQNSSANSGGALLLEQLNLMQHQQQLMAAAMAASSKGSPTKTISNNNNEPLLPSFPKSSQEQLKSDGIRQLQQQQQQQQQQQNPGFLYFMACMLLQQQQQQANQHTAAVAAAAAARQQQIQAQKPLLNPIEVLAQLTANANSNVNRQLSKPHICNASQKTLLGPDQYSWPNDLANQQQAASFSPLMSMQHQTLADGGRATATGTPAATTSQAAPSFANSLYVQHQQVAGNKFHSVNHSPRTKVCTKIQQDKHQGNHSHSHQHPHPQQQHQHQHHQQGQPRAEKVDNLKPAHSYIGLIGMCILSSPEKRMVLNDIYQFILDQYPYYRNRGSGWRNSVRHNLSLNECFQKAGRAANGKGHYWTIHPANMEDFMNGDFRRRRAQRKVRRWNNMDVPSDESDDESTEDTNRPPLPDHFKRSLEMHRRLEAMGYGPAHYQSLANPALVASLAPQTGGLPQPAQQHPNAISSLLDTSSLCPLISNQQRQQQAPQHQSHATMGQQTMGDKQQQLASGEFMRVAAQAIAAAAAINSSQSCSSSSNGGAPPVASQCEEAMELSQ